MIVETFIPEVQQIVSTDASSGLDKNMIDVYGNPFYAALAQGVETLRHAPYWHVDEKAPSRLDRARELVRNSRVLLQDERLASVYGSTKAYDVTGFHCTCPQSQKGQSAWCVHAVAVKLARALAEQGPREEGGQGVREEGSKERGGTATPAPSLPIPDPFVLNLPDAGLVSVDATGHATPMTVDPEGSEEAGSKGGHPDSHPRSSLPYSLTPFSPSPTPQEDRMPDDAYIPEPDTDETPVSVMEHPRTPIALTPVPPQVHDLEAALQVWTTERAVVQRFLKQELKANIDYYTLRIGGKDSKPSLSKAGAEKVLGWLKLQASFTPDTGTWEMLGRPTDLVCFVCTIRTRGGEIVGEGRGARSLKKDNGDANKAIKMAEKSACVSAVLRTGALSDVFTCDLEDMQEEEGSKGAGRKERGGEGTPATPAASRPSQAPAKPTSQELRQRIWARVQDLAPDVSSREDVEAFIKEHTGLQLHPDQYAAIASKLEDTP